MFFTGSNPAEVLELLWKLRFEKKAFRKDLRTYIPILVGQTR